MRSPWKLRSGFQGLLAGLALLLLAAGARASDASDGRTVFVSSSDSTSSTTTVVPWDSLYGNNGQGTGVDIGSFLPYNDLYAGTTLMNYRDPSGSASGRNAYMLHYSANTFDGDALKATGFTRNLIYSGGGNTRLNQVQSGANDLIVETTLNFKKLSLAITGAYVYLGVRSGNSYDFVTIKEATGTPGGTGSTPGGPDIGKDYPYVYGLTSRDVSYSSGGAISLDNALMQLSGNARIVTNGSSSITVDNKSAFIMNGGLHYSDTKNDTQLTSSGDMIGGGGLGRIVGPADNTINFINVDNESLFRITGNASTRSAVSDTTAIRMVATNNSSIEIFNGQDLPTLMAGNRQTDSTLNSRTDVATIDRSRIVLGRPGYFDSANELNYKFDSYAEKIDTRNPDFTTFLKGSAFSASRYTVEGMSVYDGASLIGYGSLSGKESKDDAGNTRRDEEGNIIYNAVNGGTLRMGYESVLMPAAAVLKFDKSVLDGTVAKGSDIPDSTKNTWLSDEYRYTQAENTTSENSAGHGVGMQTVEWLYDAKGNLRQDFRNSFAPAALKVTGSVTMQTGSTLILVAAGNQISTVTATKKFTFEEGSTIRVMGQSFDTDGQWKTISITDTPVVFGTPTVEATYNESGKMTDPGSEDGVVYRDAQGNESIKLPSGIFKSYIGTEASGTIRDNKLYITVNTTSNPYSGLPGVTKNSVSFGNWTVGTVIQQYYASSDTEAAKRYPRMYQMLDAYRSYGMTNDPSKTNADLTAEAYAKINPISVAYMQQQATVVDQTVRDAIQNRLSHTRPNSGISAVSTLYNEGGSLARMDEDAGGGSDYYSCGYKIWGRALANYSELDAEGETAGYTGDLYGVIVGAEQTLDRLTRGVSLAYAHSKNKPGDKDVQNYGGSMDSINLSLYGSYTFAHLFLDGMIGYTYNSAEDNRTVYFPDADFYDTAEKDYNIHAVTASMRFGAMYYVSEYRFMPSIGLDYTYYSRGSAQEKWNDGSDALRYDSMHYDRLIMPLSLSISRDFIVGDNDIWLVSPEVRGGWAHQWINDQDSFGVSYPGVNYYHDMTTLGYGRSIFSIGAGLAARYDDRITFVGTYDFQWQNKFRTHNINVGMDLLF